MERKSKCINRTLVRKFLQGSIALKDLRLADLQIFPSEDLAVLVMVSKNHIVYEVDLVYRDGQIFILDMEILAKQSEKPERFQYIGKEVR